jgi:hypothetical protein
MAQALSGFYLSKRPCGAAFKKSKKMFDLTSGFFNVTPLSAVAGRYLMYGTGGWPH